MKQIGFELVAHKSIKNLNIRHAESNQARILIVLRTIDYSNTTKELLEKIISATGCNFKSEISLVLLNERDKVFINDVMTELKIKEMISFGVKPAELGLNISGKNYLPLKLSKLKFLFSEDLRKLASDKEAKKLLWQSLQAFFELNETP